MSALTIAIGALIAAVGYNGLMVPNQLAEGGVSGVSLVLLYLTGWPLAAIYFVLNVPLVIFGFLRVGRAFTLRSLLGVALLSGAIQLTRGLVIPTPDRLLASLYSGALVGLGLGLMFRGGGSSGGVDFIARYLRDRRGVPIGQTYLIGDAAILIGVGLVLGLETALYSLIVTFVASKVVDSVLEGPARAMAALIISDRNEEIARVVTERYERGATFLQAEGAYTRQGRRVLLVVLSRRELAQLKRDVAAIDPGAFVIVAEVAEVLGEGFLRASATP